MSMIAFVLAFFSSTYVPVETMPGWLQPFARYQPVTPMVDAVRSVLVGSSGDVAWPWCGRRCWWPFSPRWPSFATGMHDMEGKRSPSVPTNSRAGQPAAPSDLVDVPRLVTAYFSEYRTRPSRTAGLLRHSGTGVRACGRASTTTTSRPPLRPSATTAGLGHPRPPVPGPGHPRPVRAAWVTALEVLAANDVTVLVDHDGYTPTPALSHAVLTHNLARGPGDRDGGRDCDHPLAQPAQRRRLQVQPPGGGPAGNGGDQGRRGPGQRPAGCRPAGGPAGDHRPRPGGGDDRHVRLSRRLRLRSLLGHRHGRHRCFRRQIGADPLGGASVAYWGVSATVRPALRGEP